MAVLITCLSAIPRVKHVGDNVMKTCKGDTSILNYIFDVLLCGCFSAVKA